MLIRVQLTFHFDLDVASTTDFENDQDRAMIARATKRELMDQLEVEGVAGNITEIEKLED